MDASTFRRLGHQLIDWIADHREKLESLPVMSSAEPGSIARRFPREPPRRGGELSSIITTLEQDILPGITHWNHPSFFAYFPSNTSYASILGDLIAAGLGAQGMSWQTSPAATELEDVVMDWLRQMVGLSPAWSGVINDTASTATLCALICAREKKQGVVYASEQAHSSVQKAAALAGFGLDCYRLIDTDVAHALRPDLLAHAIEEDLRSGRTPSAVVATVGTTATTAMDPIAAIAELAERHGLWLHVDAAMAGTAMVVPECRVHWEGIERADSLVFNPHKWMGVGFDFSAYYVRDAQHLIRVMSTNPSYLRTSQDGSVRNLRDWGIPLGRRFRALKLWLHLLDVGVEGIQARIRRDLEHAQWLAAQVDASSEWERVAPVALQTVCLRHRTADNLALADRINKSGKAYVTPSLLKGRQMIRVSIGAEGTERRHVEAIWHALTASSRA
jgi:aromatic-L-amino-acid decarboxylase